MIRRSAQAVSLLAFLVAGKSTAVGCPTDSFERIANEGIKRDEYACSFPKILEAECNTLKDSTVTILATSLSGAVSRCRNQPKPRSCSDLAECLDRLEKVLKEGHQISAETDLANKIFADPMITSISPGDRPSELGQRLQPLIGWLRDPPVPVIDPRVTQMTSDLEKLTVDFRDLESKVSRLTPFPYFKVATLAAVTSLLMLLVLRLLKKNSTSRQANQPSTGDSTVPATEDRSLLIESNISKVKEQVHDLGDRVTRQEQAQPAYRGFTETVGTLQNVTASHDEMIQRLNREAKRIADQVATLIPRLGGSARPGVPTPGPIAPLPASVTVAGPPAAMPPAPPPFTLPDDLVLDTLSRSLEEKLITTWKGFRKRRQVDSILSAFETERGALVTVPPRQGEAELRLPLNTLLITNLSEAIGEHTAVQPAYLLARGPYDTWWSFSTRLSGLRDVVSAPGNQAVPVGPTSPREKSQSQAHLFRVWDGLQLLATAELSDLADRLSSFSVKSWLKTDFLRLADVLMLERDRSRGDQLNRAYALTKIALAWAGIVPIEIRLGQDRFDSTIHVAKASDTQPHLADGVILSVVRNGFLERGAAGGEKILQRPEVIVNRV